MFLTFEREVAPAVDMTWVRKSETLVMVTSFHVNGRRRTGLGTAHWRNFESHLAPGTTVQLWSKNRRATAFWASVGFLPEHPPERDGSANMSKTV